MTRPTNQPGASGQNTLNKDEIPYKGRRTGDANTLAIKTWFPEGYSG
jgi:hypothetical protein